MPAPCHHRATRLETNPQTAGAPGGCGAPVLIVRQWLEDFETSESRLVLDGEGEIQRNYQKKLGFNDYGRQVV
jgi:hypothetical protein